LGNLATPKRVQKLQTALHAKAKAEAGDRFYALYDKISREDILAERLDDLSIFGDVHPGGRVIDPAVEADDVLCVAAVHDRLRRGSGVAYMQRASLGRPTRHEQHSEHPGVTQDV
jgi:hypothetical protein